MKGGISIFNIHSMVFRLYVLINKSHFYLWGQSSTEVVEVLLVEIWILLLEKAKPKASSLQRCRIYTWSADSSFEHWLSYIALLIGYLLIHILCNILIHIPWAWTPLDLDPDPFINWPNERAVRIENFQIGSMQQSHGRPIYIPTQTQAIHQAGQVLTQNCTLNYD